jgi:multiple sugar transport system ATP-binding protein
VVRADAVNCFSAATGLRLDEGAGTVRTEPATGPEDAVAQDAAPRDAVTQDAQDAGAASA